MSEHLAPSSQTFSQSRRKATMMGRIAAQELIGQCLLPSDHVENIVGELNAPGIRVRRGERWHMSNVQDLLARGQNVATTSRKQ